MATEASSLSQSPVTTKDEFEGLEVTEFEANVPWGLLQDEPGEEKAESDEVPMQAIEAVGPNSDILVESCWFLDGINDNVQDFNWSHILEETSIPCNDMIGWYGGPCMDDMNEILVVGDYSFSQSAITCDEIGYIGLWQDN